ncbi:MAG: Na(+)/H(+) antiporter NhaA [Gammaproteobacteria bacterium RIFCSPLOWO2_02_FULL_42_14]|nr:MAG: Na(+)/H(+) antiporter NhaA [Gammaproteobacteria bacterium RIFCSPHIGHO2_02_FULL_42_43]OGT28094.1 MAG: Na(+)/H(+) antiporter NhaA [Gammaproteobacteria bacterium RIFCSPHIGHO2_01_FULL_42_8]OGT51208.1 MAG: Na(+)/H(+) antiporter NhaA [Gammaproteobacteria bacterium RIFCSPHIGHO2_12_FULL_41_25]OGT62969.1 MAG: Na(+)/H(+) antiporter NhaA [Gammaproteobacteria bacterium RIFCSPLOWO2_02_FULL_42_14]OGT86102.1 MAG: Na(+)/H(+) antiporter NhaA [Gammaproteobacteria bacterium RIFCSPLOWO2_12_FULL_42_18]
MPFRLIREFIKLESAAGTILFLTAVLAILVDNTPFAAGYEAFFKTIISFSIGQFQLSKPLLLWVNDGFMSIFFLLVGLEIKREMMEGELNSISKATLPAIAAFGGMLFPAIIYAAINWHHPVAIQGWAIPTATDTAFSLAILTLLGSRIPVGLKIFLTALAIFDDIGAIIVMAIFYSSHISAYMLLCALGLIVVLLLMNYLDVQRPAAYFIVGIILWMCLLKSGIHATLAGIILAFTIPMKSPESTKSLLRTLEHRLHPWVAFGVLPLFAFANAGVSLTGFGWEQLATSIPVGIAAGLFLGKQLGIWGVSMLAVRLRIARLPQGVTGFGLYGLSLAAGVGFTMSLFIGTLAFHSVMPYATFVRVGVIAGSLISGFLGYWILRWAYPTSSVT